MFDFSTSAEATASERNLGEGNCFHRFTVGLSCGISSWIVKKINLGEGTRKQQHDAGEYECEALARVHGYRLALERDETNTLMMKSSPGLSARIGHGKSH